MYAIAEFGSKSRGRSDSISDHDILFVGPNHEHHRYRKELNNLGFSVTTLTPIQLEHMAKANSLFVKHLRDEAIIRWDVEGAFRAFLDQTESAIATDEDLQACKDSLEFLAGWPDHPLLVGWKADLLYCISRDYLIKISSRTRWQIYGLDALPSVLRRELGWTIDAMKSLAGLRLAKARYRKGLDHGSFTLSQMRFWLGELGVESSPPKFKLHKLSRLLDRDFTSPYERLRTLEACYTVARAKGVTHPRHTLLQSIIKQPNGYGSCRSARAGELSKMLEEVLILVEEA